MVYSSASSSALLFHVHDAVVALVEPPEVYRPEGDGPHAVLAEEVRDPLGRALDAM